MKTNKPPTGARAPLVPPPLGLMSAHPSWFVFPVRALAKHPPCFPDNLRLASNDPNQIAKWAKLYPGCNWAIALARSHVIVLDIDQKPGKHGRDTLERRELEHGQLPGTFEVSSASGGRHIYFAETDTVKHHMRLGAFGPDIDSPNYTLAPGSLLASGHGYRIIVNAPVAPAPAWFAEYLGAPTISHNSDQTPAIEQDTPDLIASAIHFLKYDAPPAIEGRNGEWTLLVRVAAVLKDHGISEQMAVDLLAEHYNPRCEPSWDVYEGSTEDRLDVKVHNAWLCLKQTQPGACTARAAFGDDDPEIEETEADRRLARQRTFSREDRYGFDTPMLWKAGKS
jgi:hypothetical protein